jgi:large subunit ribosomal protein L31
MPKAAIHPKYEMAKIHCACGNNWESHTTQGDMNIEMCDQCHPFYTGKQKQVYTTGRVDRFFKKYKKD